MLLKKSIFAEKHKIIKNTCPIQCIQVGFRPMSEIIGISYTLDRVFDTFDVFIFGDAEIQGNQYLTLFDLRNC